MDMIADRRTVRGKVIERCLDCPEYVYLHLDGDNACRVRVHESEIIGHVKIGADITYSFYPRTPDKRRSIRVIS